MIQTFKNKKDYEILPQYIQIKKLKMPLYNKNMIMPISRSYLMLLILRMMLKITE